MSGFRGADKDVIVTTPECLTDDLKTPRLVETRLVTARLGPRWISKMAIDQTDMWSSFPPWGNALWLSGPHPDRSV